MAQGERRELCVWRWSFDVTNEGDGGRMRANAKWIKY